MNTQKAQVDVIYLVVMLFAVTVSLLVVDQVWSGLTSNSAFISLKNSTPQGHLAVKSVNTSLNIFNNAIVLLFVMGAIVAIISAAFTDSSPVFLIPSIVVLPIEILFAFIFHDMFFSILQNSAFGSVAASYPYIVTLFQYLPVVSFVIAIIVIVATFMK